MARRLNRFSLLTLFFFSLFLPIPPTPAKAEAPSQKKERNITPVTLALKWKHQFQFAGYYAALEKGYYRDAGLDVTILEASKGEESYEKVLSGEATFGIAMSDLVLHRSQGHPVVALAAIFQHSPLVLLVPSGRGIGHLHDLAGKNVMIEPHASELLAYLDSEGVPASKMVVHPHTFNTRALLAGQVDAISAYSTDEPYDLEAAGTGYHLFSPRSGGIDFYGDTLFTTEQEIRRHPEVVKAFVDASLAGWRYALDHPEEIVDLILEKYSKRHSREHLLFEAEMTRRLILPHVVEIGYMNPGRWKHIADVYNRMQMVPEDVPLEGFLYERDPHPDLTWLYLWVGGTLLALALIGGVALRFYRLNESLNREALRRQEVQQRLEEQEHTLSLLIGNLPGMVYRCENKREWPMEYVSDGCLALTGYPASDFTRPDRTLYAEIIHPEDREGVWRDVQSGLADNGTFECTYRIRTATGGTKWVWERGDGIPGAEEGLRLEGFITDISDLKEAEQAREKLIQDLQQALEEIKTLRGIIPICSSCKRIRDDQGAWNRIEAYIEEHSEADFSHGICPDCSKKLYPEFHEEEEDPKG